MIIWLSVLLLPAVAWINGGIILPRKDGQMAAAFWNNTIYILGGVNNDRQMVAINGSYGYEDKGTNVLQTNFMMYSHCYTQISDTSIIYYIDWIFDKVIIYDLKNRKENGKLTAHNISDQTCVTSGENIVYFIGGQSDMSPTGIATVQAYNISDGKWISSVPDMNLARQGGHSCVFDKVHQQLWVLGGGNGYVNPAKKVEKINTTDIVTQQWQNSTELLSPAHKSGAIYYKGFIMIMGYDNGGVHKPTYVQIVNCSSGYVFKSEPLSYAVAQAATILVNDRVYLIGGLGGSWLNTFQYLDLSVQYLESFKPTQTPTNNPSFETNNPTLTPSFFPTNTPTLITYSPTKISNNPSFHPTKMPTTPSPTLIVDNNIVWPTFTPTNLEQNIDKVYSSTERIGEMKNDDERNRILSTVMIVLGIGCVCSIGMLYIVVKKWRNKKDKYKTDTYELKMTQIESDMIGYVPPNIITAGNEQDKDIVKEINKTAMGMRDMDIVKQIDKTAMGVEVDNERDMDIVKQIDKTAIGVPNQIKQQNETHGNVSTIDDEFSDDSEHLANTVGETDY